MGPVTTGSLIQRSFLIFRSGFVSFATLALIFYSPIVLLRFLEPAGEPAGADPDMALAASSTAILLLLLAYLLLIPVASAAVVYGVFRGLRGKPATIVQCLSVAASRGPAILGLALLNLLVVGLGFLLCITPGVILTCGLFIAGPALIVEQLDPITAMRRSWQLTDGHKLTILILALTIGVLQLGISIPITMALGADTSGNDAFGNEDPATDFGLYEMLDSLLTIVFIAFNAVAAAVTYHDLRSLREGSAELGFSSI